MIEQASTLTVIGLLLTLIIKAMQWFSQMSDKKQKERDAIKKDISDAVYSGDVSRINAIVQQLRR